MTSITINFLSGLTTRINCYCAGKPILSPATGFYYQFEDKMYLVSNWHVFSGRSIYTGQPIDDVSCAVPNELEFYLRERNQTRHTCRYVISENEQALWMQHPTKGQDVDIAVLELPKEFSPYQFSRANTSDNRQDMLVEVGDDVFILGYPRAINKQGELPVWKRGSIASEPDLTVDGNECILIDSATRDGMSGSPVFKYAKGIFLTKHSMVGGETASKFIGVYSGRYGSTDLESIQLARCWSAKLVDEVIIGRRRGDYILRVSEQ